MTEYDAAAEWWKFINTFGMALIGVVSVLGVAGAVAWFISLIVEKQERAWDEQERKWLDNDPN